MITIDEFFANAGPLAAVIPGYRERSEQVRLAKAVSPVLDVGGALLGDGPTGTGKSMAYLAPIALGMRENRLTGEVDGKAIVSTATKALQHQLVAKDLPTLARACEEVGIRTPTYALLKGRGEFLCDRRMNEYLEEEGLLQDPTLVAIDLWRQSTTTGDKESLPETITPPAYWSEIAADADDCVRHHCKYGDTCFYYQQKEFGRGADILVVNHALLLANLAAGGAVFSLEGRHLVIDEAHRLEEYVCEAFGARVSRHRIRYVLSAVRRKSHDLDDYIESASAAADDFFGELRSSANRALGNPTVTPPSYTELVDALIAITTSLENNPQEVVNKLAGMVDRLLGDLRSFYEPLRGTHAYAVLDPRDRGYPTLQSWLVEPAEVVPEAILEREEGAATIMTSATLATGRSFDYQRRRLGFDMTNGLRVREFLGAEMFDYQKNALVYLESELPPPTPANTEEFLDGAVLSAAELVNISQGRALILLATWKAVQRFKETFSEEVAPFPVRYQGEASTSSLIGWLKDTPNAVLVGTRSLWEGVDVAGEALSLVIVDKVPFPPPTDPVIEKLCEKAGSAWFPEVSLPKAMLAIRQGLGRLIRRHDDRGIMVILDSRITTSTWGPVMRKAVPRGTPTTSDVEDVEEFFSRFPGVGPRAA